MSRLATMLMARVAPAVTYYKYSANDLTAIIPDLYEGLDVVSRELVGFIPSVFRNASAERAAVGQSIVYPIAPAPTRFNVTPAMTIPETTDKTVGSGTLAITKSVGYEFGFTGEEQRAVNNAQGIGFSTVQADMFAQSLRLLCNEIEVDLAVEGYRSASRATGTSGTTPFGSNFDEVADLRKILDDNGAPASDRSLVINTSAGANLRKKSQLTKANEAGTVMTLRQGELLDIHGMSIKESAGVSTHTKGTGASYQLTAAAIVGQTALTVDTGTGTVLAGDVITLAGDTNQYVVETALDGGVITIAKPGLRVTAADNTVITVTDNFAGNLAFTRNALHLIMRAPALPNGGDAAIDSMMLADPRSGLTFEVRMYAAYRKIRAEIAAAWGVGGIKSEHMAILKG